MSGAQESVPSSSMQYSMRLSMLPSYFLNSIPGFRKKTAPHSEQPGKQRSDVAYGDWKTSHPQERNLTANNSKILGAPPLLPSVSDSALIRSKKKTSSAKALRKILVANPTTTNGTTNKTYENGNVAKINVGNKLNGGITSPQKMVDSPDKAQMKSRPKPSNHQNENSGASTASSSSQNDYPAQEFYFLNPARGGASKAASTAQIILQSNNTSSTTSPPTSARGKQPVRGVGSSLLSQLGLGNSSSSYGKATTSAAASPTTMVIPVRPIDSFGASENEASLQAASHGKLYSSYGSSVGTSSAVHTNAVARGPQQGAAKPADPAQTGSSISSSTSTTTTAATTSKPKAPCCDKCDGKHETDDCPHYKKKREDHPDAQKSAKRMGGVSSLPGNTLYTARVVRQPGDGSCLFHSMSYGLPSKSNAAKLRAEICQFIVSNPELKISDTPLQDWVKWDSNSSVSEYARKMSRGSWGGGIEMACVSQMKDVNVHVYERSGVGLKRISAFDRPVNPETKPVIRVLYCGGVHYDAIVT